ncbi:MAG: hypothetical protein ACKVHP_05925 [Verrucomicrobiales bacterium]
MTTLIGALIASSAWFAVAQRPEGGGDRQRGGRGVDRMKMIPIFVALDTDKDGVLSENEIQNATAALLTLDKDNDKKLSAEEIAPAFGGRQRGGGGRQRGGEDGAERPERPKRPGTEKAPAAPKSE